MIRKIAKKVLKTIFGSTKTQKYEPPKKKITNYPLVSFIIPARNEEKSIERCLQAILDDDYLKKEIIIVNDQSTDRTTDIVKKMRKKNNKTSITLVNNKKRLGPGPSRSEGMKVCKGEIIIMLDAHSIITSKGFTKEYLKYFQDERVGAVAGGRSWQPKYYTDKILYYAGGLRPWREMGFQFLDTPNSAFRRSAYEEIGGIDTNLTWGSDLSTTFRMLEHNYLIPTAPKAEITIDHAVTPNRRKDFIRKPFFYGSVINRLIKPYWKWLWRRKVDVRIIIGGLINTTAIIIAIATLLKLWWLPVITIGLFRAHSLAFAAYNRTPVKYYVGIPIILTISEMAYSTGFIYGYLKKAFGDRKTIAYK